MADYDFAVLVGFFRYRDTDNFSVLEGSLSYGGRINKWLLSPLGEAVLSGLPVLCPA